jgi:alpha-D-ribose 1-methylphosphonate 5-triphosphate synthase subunit PhnG
MPPAMPDATPLDQPRSVQPPSVQPPLDQANAARRHWMAVLARADAVAISERIATSGGMPEYRTLRGPDAGLVMVRGRAGGGGAAFNLGEMTVTRCSVRTDAGFVGHAYVAGRDDRKAEMAALADALLQDPARRPRLLATLIAPLAAVQLAGRDATAAKAAATRVQFFAMRNMRA